MTALLSPGCHEVAVCPGGYFAPEEREELTASATSFAGRSAHAHRARGRRGRSDRCSPTRGTGADDFVAITITTTSTAGGSDEPWR